NPFFKAFAAMVRFPAAVFGPVDFRALRRFASTFLVELVPFSAFAVRLRPSELTGAVVCEPCCCRSIACSSCFFMILLFSFLDHFRKKSIHCYHRSGSSSYMGCGKQSRPLHGRELLQF